MKYGVITVLVIALSSKLWAETYVVGAQDIQYYPHYDFSKPDDKGLAWAILQVFAEQSGHTLVYHHMPVKRLQLELRKGNVDFVYPDNPKWYNQNVPAEEKFFSTPLTRALGGTIVRPEDVGRGIDSIRRLAIPLGFTPVNWQHRVDARQTQLVHVTDTLSALYLLERGRVDAANLEYSVTQYLTSTAVNYGPFTLDPALPHDNVGFMLSTMHHPDIIDELNTFLATHRDVINSLQSKYLLQRPDSILEQLQQRFYGSESG
ncbi:hypothetical protein OCL06_09465 [Alteromonas sp. ASW11-19]|uniref:Solute-binding protein family 3/N-terminal domain-containing protein n=1 Tax=Alteromonas salexigens TaxID=2982530 RepID=A0ABT2VNE6_9ALTE|nr:transporter substrate-binding domain-containing protein [Alteromonas salexigens]MCU7554827.1 hypothetical protein [Alteromonas salexigens]